MGSRMLIIASSALAAKACPFVHDEVTHLKTGHVKRSKQSCLIGLRAAYASKWLDRRHSEFGCQSEHLHG